MRTRKFRYSILVLCAFLLSARMSLAQQTINPNTISYQGMIVDSSGKPLPDGTIPISVSLWTAPTGGTRIWSDSFNPNVKSGVFNISLGSGNPFAYFIEYG